MGKYFELHIKCENAAFDEAEGTNEVSLLLAKISAQVNAGQQDGMIFDTNGNYVGEYGFVEKED